MFKRTFLLSIAAAALLAGSALADGSTPVKGPFAGTVHAVGTLSYTDGSSQTWNWDRGKITALDSTSITLTRRDKVQVTFAITSSTVVRNDGATYQLSDLKIGQVATVISQSGNADIIRNIRGDGAPSGADQSAIEGPAAKSTTGTIDALYYDGSSQTFQYDRGRITSVGNGQLSIVRADKSTATFTYDDSTIVRDKDNVEAVSDLQVGEGAMFFSQNGKLMLVTCLGQPKQPQANPQGQGQLQPGAGVQGQAGLGLGFRLGHRHANLGTTVTA